ncbi:hypothetical protein WN55_00050 [Dufourea novaeangliae]|uniref:Uncharacterized protein n=1 Tax=Dufourea novaeangliae TaxID=178035 RepID=A0A154NWB3_DUFNO|nr:hypothetical protein WN55_00050 [Dufourea novaeangliae]
MVRKTTCPSIKRNEVNLHMTSTSPSIEKLFASTYLFLDSMQVWWPVFGAPPCICVVERLAVDANHRLKHSAVTIRKS